MTRVLKQDLTLTLVDLLSLLRGGTLSMKIRPSDGSTGVEAQISVWLSDVPTHLRQKAIKLLLSEQKDHMDSWVMRPDGHAAPAVGTEAWLAYIVTNADRIWMRDANGSEHPLTEYPIDMQAEVIAGWVRANYTPVPKASDARIIAALDPVWNEASAADPSRLAWVAEEAPDTSKALESARFGLEASRFRGR